MNRLWKTVGAVALSLLLIQSTSAWAFLKCSHEWDSTSDPEKLEAPSPESSNDADAAELECSHPDYQLGPIATNSFSPEMLEKGDGIGVDIFSKAPIAQAPYISRISHFLERFTLFDKLSLQLSLSILRI